MKKFIVACSLILLVCKSQVIAQGFLDSLDSMVSQPKQVDYTEATFKAPRLVNGQTVELIGKKELAVLISHRFAPISEGAYYFYGLTESKIRLGLDYGLSNRINIGIGIGSYQRISDGFIKIKLLRQSSGMRNMPITMVFTSTAFYSDEKWTDPNRNNLYSSRFYYSHQLQIARKFNNTFSLQITPGLLHRNLVATDDDQNDVYSVSMGGRVKLTKRFALNAEYNYLLPGQTADDFANAFSLGLDIETGGHIFQLLFTNAISPQEKVTIAETTNQWKNGDIHFGFNIIRTFGLSHRKNNTRQ